MNNETGVKRRPLDLSGAFIRRIDLSYADLERANLTAPIVRTLFFAVRFSRMQFSTGRSCEVPMSPTPAI